MDARPHAIAGLALHRARGDPAGRRPALGRRIEELREELRQLNLTQLRASDRRQLRMLYADLGSLA